MMKKLVKDLCPPIALRFAQAAADKLAGRKPPYRKQVYQRVEDIPAISGDIWNSDAWLDRVKDVLQQVRSDDLYKPHLHEEGLIAAFNVAAALKSGKTIHVVDIGGGVGVYYPPLARAVRHLNREFVYHVFDSSENVAYGGKEFSGDANIVFHSSDEDALALLAELWKQDDVLTVVNLSSVLQYIMDWRGFLEKIAQTHPELICISRFPVCDNAKSDAFAVQDISIAGKYCGSAVVNLFAGNGAVSLLDASGYSRISETQLSIGDAQYFQGRCEDKAYEQITMKCFVFVRIARTG